MTAHGKQSRGLSVNARYPVISLTTDNMSEITLLCNSKDHTIVDEQGNYYTPLQVKDIICSSTKTIICNQSLQSLIRCGYSWEKLDSYYDSL